MNMMLLWKELRNNEVISLVLKATLWLPVRPFMICRRLSMLLNKRRIDYHLKVDY
uniref:Uncharacterized protein n=1 Tax=uncultured marine virus TaxID=186617 RepID=A0A0F7L4L0_9VIRU|nr:hypothetical protein [uncultured marine virus]